MKYSTLIAPFALAFAFGCASSAPSSQLVDARRAYDQARTSDANAYSPDKVLEARQALERAERAHSDDPGSFKEKSLAYVAQREAQLAQAYAALSKAERERAQADTLYKQRQDELRRNAENQAQMAQQNLNSAQSALSAQGAQLSAQQTQLEKEREARAAAEKRAAAAMASLSEIARVKEESRGTVITLDGSVLFVSGKSELLPVAREKLDSVAKALTEIDDDQAVLIEGHTDSKGPDDANLRLSQARADSVREYLISRGVKADRVRSVGRGEQQPVASNDTAEGRANNRRVEIIVQPSQRNGASPTTTGSNSNTSGSGSSMSGTNTGTTTQR